MIMSHCNEIDFVPNMHYYTLQQEARYIMRKVDLNMNEQLKYETIKKLVETNGNKHRAAQKLGCTIRTINRLIIAYKKYGKSAFQHKNNGRKPSHTFDESTKQNVIDLFRTKYSGCNIKHFTELLSRHENICVSDTTVRNWLADEMILSPKAKKKTIKRMKSNLKKAKNSSKTIKDIRQLDNQLELLDRHDAHPRRPRCAYFGELIQMDASPHLWFGDIITHLHLAIDDSTGRIVGGYFDTQETLNGYYNVLFQILTNHGIPAKFLTDRRTVFEYKRKNVSSDEEDTYTQFSYACKQLGIELECSSVPQAKGRIERLNQTLQSRLVIELRLANVTTIEEANKFLNSYIKEFNKQFSLPINSTKTVFETQPKNDTINKILSIFAERKIDAGHSIKFKNKFYKLVDKSGKDIFVKKGMTVMVIQSFDGSLYANLLDHLYALEEIPIRRDKSQEFDSQAEPKHQKRYIPPLSHPWKKASFLKFLATQKHRQDVYDRML